MRRIVVAGVVIVILVVVVSSCILVLVSVGAVPRIVTRCPAVIAVDNNPLVLVALILLLLLLGRVSVVGECPAVFPKMSHSIALRADGAISGVM